METGELDLGKMMDVATWQCKKYLEALATRDIVKGNKAIKGLRAILDAAANEIDFDWIWDDPVIEYPNKTFCFTGVFYYGSRQEIEATVIERGGLIGKNVSLKLDYLIVGSDTNQSWAHQNYGRKIERALEIRDKSRDRPYIIHETDWIKSL
jgi:NAD-dependent DNA ligase